MKILITPDKFKGSLTAQQVCNAVEKGINKVLPNVEKVKLPIADGGEQSLEALENTIEFKRIYITVNNPLFKPINTWYGLKGKKAYIEMAKASGLQLLSKAEQNPINTSSYGTGEIILDAINKGANSIFLFIGGSATNDAAIGIAEALGYSFYNSDNNKLLPIGKSLPEIVNIKYKPKVDLEKIDITVLTDVQNPFCGNEGAAKIYAPQKGANQKETIMLDEGLKNITNVFKSILDKDIELISGSGAAGGIGGGMMAMFNAELKSGIETIFGMLKFDKQIKKCDFVITGEGKFDMQTLKGKVVKGVIDKCKKLNKTVGVVCGVSTLNEKDIINLGKVIVKPIVNDTISISKAINNAKFYVERSSATILKTYLNEKNRLN